MLSSHQFAAVADAIMVVFPLAAAWVDVANSACEREYGRVGSTSPEGQPLMSSTYRIDDGVSRIALDDGKVNALSSGVLMELDARLDQTVADGATALIVTGREGVLCAGFDLAEVRSGADAQSRLRLLLIDLVLRLFDFDCPVVMASPGHAMAAGAALLLAADRRVGLDGPYKVGFNEAALGVTISGATVELARYRMPMPWFESVASGETFAPPQAVAAGLLDRVVDEADALPVVAAALADELRRAPLPVFLEMRRQARREVADRIRAQRQRLVQRP